jgi:hypothetical protein
MIAIDKVFWAVLVAGVDRVFEATLGSGVEARPENCESSGDNLV